MSIIKSLSLGETLLENGNLANEEKAIAKTLVKTFGEVIQNYEDQALRSIDYLRVLDSTFLVVNKHDGKLYFAFAKGAGADLVNYFDRTGKNFNIEDEITLLQQEVGEVTCVFSCPFSQESSHLAEYAKFAAEDYLYNLNNSS